jgi:hypothetical protein
VATGFAGTGFGLGLPPSGSAMNLPPVLFYSYLVLPTNEQNLIE